MNLQEYIASNKLNLLNYTDNIKAHQFASEIDAANWENGMDVGKWLADAAEQHKRIDWMISMIHGSVLDIGCGNGMVTNFMIAQPHINKNRVVGLNLSRRELIFADKWKTKSQFVCGVSEHLPFKDASFDSIVAGEIIEHVVNPDTFVQECKRVLTNNGILILTTPYHEENWLIGEGINQLHVRQYDTVKMKELLDKHRFINIVTLSGNFGELFDYDYYEYGSWNKKIVSRRMSFIYAAGIAPCRCIDKKENEKI